VNGKLTVDGGHIVDDSIKYKVGSILFKYPKIMDLAKKSNKKESHYHLKRDQYSGDTDEKYKEHRLASVLLNSINDSQYLNQLTQLDKCLQKYPTYIEKKFGNRLVENFFSFYSEIEVYHYLKKAGVDPERDVVIGPKGENLDFKININGKDFLIEVTTPRASEDFEDKSDKMRAEWCNPESGIHIEKIRIKEIIENEINKHFKNIDKSFSIPVILVINYSYAYPEIECGDLDFIKQNPPRYFYGILLYKSVLQKKSYFYPNPNLKISKEEINFFNGLMEN